MFRKKKNKLINNIVKNNQYCTVILEKSECIINILRLDDRGNCIGTPVVEEWSPTAFIEETGVRLFEELTRRIENLVNEYGQVEKILVSMPGTIKDYSIVKSSSRIGIKKEIKAREYISARMNTDTMIIHDMDCMLVGVFSEKISSGSANEKTLSFIFVDEGVGASFLVNGKIHHGAGIAGHISRLVVVKNGIYSHELSGSGLLESFTTRSSISQLCVQKYNSAISKETDSQFRRMLEGVNNSGNYSTLNYEYINIGLKEKDSVAIAVIDDAAVHLGSAINSIVTIMHPHEIVLGGGVVTKINGFYEKVLEEVQSLSWKAAWNEVVFRKSDSVSDREEQVKGMRLLCSCEQFMDLL